MVNILVLILIAPFVVVVALSGALVRRLSRFCAKWHTA